MSGTMVKKKYKPLGVNVNPAAEEAVVDLLANVFNGIAFMDPETVRHNVELGCEGGMPRADRSIRAELANYFITHSCIVLMGMVTNGDFRGMVMEAVATEIALDDEPEEEVRRAREAMSEGVGPLPASKGNYVVDLSKYDDGLYRKLSGMLADSIAKAAEFENEIDAAAAELSTEDKDAIGFCASNFMYLIRAVAKNRVFAELVKSTIKSVQDSLDMYF